MYKTILVVTDGSEAATRAVEFASELAAKFEVSLVIGHVLQFGRPTEEWTRMAEVEHMIEHTAKASGISYKNTPGSVPDLFASSLPSSDIVRLTTILGDELARRAKYRARELGAKDVKTTVTQGDPADEILDLIDETGAGMVVLGHRGLGRIRSMIQGSVSQKINQQSGCTVVSVR